MAAARIIRAVMANRIFAFFFMVTDVLLSKQKPDGSKSIGQCINMKTFNQNVQMFYVGFIT